MNIDILEIKDTKDGGAIVTVEVDRDYLHMALEYFLIQALRDKIDETFREAASREVLMENELPSNPNPKSEGLTKTLEGMVRANTDWDGSFTYPHER
jgi:hypothetical protein